MKSSSRFFGCWLIFGVTACLSARAQTNQALVPTPPADGTNAASSSQLETPAKTPLEEAAVLTRQEKYAEALPKVSAILQADPKNFDALNLRGYIYTKQKSLDLAQKDFEAMLQLQPKSVPTQFNLYELKFQQKDYDGARSGFASLTNDSDWGDLSSYKVYLCDLFGGHTDAAKKELDVFNTAGSNPSYYAGNAAWELYNKRPEAARPWLNSAQRIYYPAKLENYLYSLKDLGYLPLPPAPHL